MSLNGRAALAYARRGLPVFPVRPRDKQPLIRSPHPANSPERLSCRGECGQDGHGCWDATVDLDRIRAWWTRWPNANIGVRTGELFDALDLDGPEGIAAMQRFAAEHGFSLDRVPYVPTPGGGLHYYFAPTGLGNVDPKLKRVDWRGRGGYAVAGPSVHPNGRTYAEVPVGADRPPFVPAALRGLLEPPKPEPAPSRATFRPASTTTAYARAALEGTQARILAAARGERNMVAFREGAGLFGLVAGGVVSESDATAVLDDAMRAVGLGAREIATTIASARRHGMQRPRGIPAEPSSARVPPPGAVLSQDAFSGWKNGKAEVVPTRHVQAPAVFPTERLREVYRMLAYRSYLDGQRRRVCTSASQARLAETFGVSERTVERDLDKLEELGFISSEPSPSRQQADGRWRRDGPNRYVLHLDPAAVTAAVVDATYARTDPTHPPDVG